MIGFLIRKNFYDFWDNLFRMMIVNFGFIASVGVTMLAPAFLPELLGLATDSTAATVVMTVLVGAGFLWTCVYLSAMALSVKEVSDYKSFGFKDFLNNLKEGWVAGILFGLMIIAMVVVLFTGLPFYLRMNSLLGVFIAAILFWSAFIIILALQFWFPIRSRLDKRPMKILKKCFLILMDNPALAFFLLITNTITLFLSTIIGFLLPGPAAALLFLDQALRLRLYKYDWLEEHPDANRRKIPWEELIAEDREKTGTRSLRSFIFPWKD